MFRGQSLFTPVGDQGLGRVVREEVSRRSSRVRENLPQQKSIINKGEEDSANGYDIAHSWGSKHPKKIQTWNWERAAHEKILLFGVRGKRCRTEKKPSRN